MALWMTALKLVPWRDVMEATPQILQTAKKLMGKTRAGSNEPGAGTMASADALEQQAPVSVAAQFQQLNERVAQLEQEQRAGAALIESLAEQNAVVIKAVEALRVRSQRLTVATGVLSVWSLGLLGWLVWQ